MAALSAAAIRPSRLDSTFTLTFLPLLLLAGFELPRDSSRDDPRLAAGG